MTRIVLSFLVASGLAFLAACDSLTYSPGDVEETVVDSTSAPLDIDLVSAPDTLVLWGYVSLRVQVDDPRPVRWTEVLLDGERVPATTRGETVSFSSGFVPDGAYDLRVRTYVGSETGSLADLYRQETVVGEERRVVLVDNAAPEPLTARIGPEAGRLVVRWDAVRRPGFQVYRVYSISPQGFRSLRATITDPETTVWVDSTIVGGVGTYAVDIAASDQEARGIVVEEDFGMAEVLTVEPQGPEAVVTWSASPFPANVTAYVLERFGGSQLAPTEAARTSASETTVTDRYPPIFGATFSYDVRTLGDGTDVWREDPVGGVRVDASTPASAVYAYLPEADAFVASLGPALTLARLDGETFAETARFGGPGSPAVSVQPDGQILLAGEDFRLVDPLTFEVLHTVDREPLLGAARPMVSSDFTHNVTADGVLIASYGEFHSPAFYAYLGVVVVDIPDARVLDRLDATGRRPPSFSVDYTPLEVSLVTPDGAYVVIETRGRNPVLHGRDAEGALVELGPISIPSPREAVFIDDRHVALRELGAEQIGIYEVPSFARVRELTVPSFFGLAFDRATGVLYGRQSSEDEQRLIGVGVDTGETVVDVALARGVGRVDLVNGVLWGGGSVRRVLP